MYNFDSFVCLLELYRVFCFFAPNNSLPKRSMGKQLNKPNKTAQTLVKHSQPFCLKLEISRTANIKPDCTD